MKSFDYIVVGAGSAGCALAARLAEDPSFSVCLIEAGPHDRSIFVTMPSGLGNLVHNPRYNWMYESEPEPNLLNRRIACPRGKVLGGSSSINGMVFLRGNALDYNNWATLPGLEGWSYRNVLPYFKRLETWSGGENFYRGGSGPVKITRPSGFSNVLSEAYMESGPQAGHSSTEDPNGKTQGGFCHLDQTIHNGRRSSSSASYLKGQSNLTILDSTTTEKVLIEAGKALGVRVTKNDKHTDIFANKEVLLCSGAVDSPKLLMLSGIGPADDLRRLGIDVVMDLPGVGENLQDHSDLYLYFECTQPVSLYSHMNPWGKLKIGLQWLTTKTGLGATNHFEAGCHVHSAAAGAAPDLQNTIIPLAVSYEGGQKITGHSFAMSLSPLRPTSRGSLALRSANPKQSPKIQVNYLQTEADRDTVRFGVNFVRDIVRQKAFDRYRGKEIGPGIEVSSRDEIDAFARANLSSGYHLCGTCKMGLDERAVVGPDLRVHGVEGLRVADASIVPSIPSANTNAVSIMIGEKGADLVLGKPPLEAA